LKAPFSHSETTRLFKIVENDSFNRSCALTLGEIKINDIISCRVAGHLWEEVMKTRYMMALSMLAGTALSVSVGAAYAQHVDSAIEQSHAALEAILKGDASRFLALFSDRDDVTLGNPFGPYVRGRSKVEETATAAASNYRDGEVTGVELVAKYVSGDLACVVEVERGRAKVGGANELAPLALRVTSLFRLERGAWKLVHRHADPITTARPGTSVINR
jgi:ketosteroid isomerase-like protein